MCIKKKMLTIYKGYYINYYYYSIYTLIHTYKLYLYKFNILNCYNKHIRQYLI